MKVRVLKPFVDILDASLTHKVGEILDLTSSRVEVALTYGYVEKIEEPKKRTTKKKGE